ncbi:MotA/TolQ/ExbB proton channel family protein [Pandoraea sp.]|uniref:MotA/TolQ/ExbB proton channel family protein n=1 Tax=Pandoraea sp. TaxID=1883445 RepID=UPI00120C56C6|nr:MotA/TolQ/ExbB proton channel family protein [Pandoraea sp.]TAL56554.1 MAG: MotA/TolQ/ExbB proton channel family protein [Pandoraea sp.]TAM15375.1 MAG: MotA/TolQ/ExbB proton channel family protein [Pandoraea sp.]
MFAVIKAAGWPIWPLLIASIVALALIVERTISLRRDRVLPPDVLDKALQLVRRPHAKSSEALEQMALASALGKILVTGVRFVSQNPDAPRDVAKETIEETGRAVAHELERYLSALGTIASVAPLMGLFGTVVGMIEIFGSQTAAGTDPTQLAHGISVALYNTGFGLMIAIPAMIFYRYFRARVDAYLVELETQAVHFLDATVPRH